MLGNCFHFCSGDEVWEAGSDLSSSTPTPIHSFTHAHT